MQGEARLGVIPVTMERYVIAFLILMSKFCIDPGIAYISEFLLPKDIVSKQGEQIKTHTHTHTHTHTPAAYLISLFFFFEKRNKTKSILPL